MTRKNRPRRIAPPSTIAAAALLVAALPGPAAADPTQRDLHAARCGAALEVLSQDLARQAKGGNAAARTTLMDRLVAGASFIGDAYLRGTADEAQAKAARAQALEAQKKLSPAELAARQSACAQEGAGLYASANGFQQFVVRRVAQKRFDKLLGTPGDGAQATTSRREQP